VKNCLLCRGFEPTTIVIFQNYFDKAIQTPSLFYSLTGVLTLRSIGSFGLFALHKKVLVKTLNKFLVLYNILPVNTHRKLGYKNILKYL
jgi:hypothetical protein